MATPLEAYDKVVIDPEEYARLVREGEEPDERGIIEGGSGATTLVARTWVRGFLCYTHDDSMLQDGTTIAAGTGFCPICGGRLDGAAQ
jgi:hypothetical protein